GVEVDGRVAPRGVHLPSALVVVAAGREDPVGGGIHHLMELLPVSDRQVIVLGVLVEEGHVGHLDVVPVRGAAVAGVLAGVAAASSPVGSELGRAMNETGTARDDVAGQW